MAFNATFNNISVISGIKKRGGGEDKCYNIVEILM
jgi:hypothetical protein